MQWSQLRCPKCQASYPLARLYTRYLFHKCPACGAKLTVSMASSVRLGKTVGSMLWVLIPLMQFSLIAWRGEYFGGSPARLHCGDDRSRSSHWFRTRPSDTRTCWRIHSEGTCAPLG